MNLDILPAAAEFKFADEGATGEFTGYGSTFGNIDQGGDIVERGAFADALKERTPADIKMLFQHNAAGFPIGDWLEIRENDRGLVVRGRLDLDDPDGARAYNAMRKGRLKGLSIGYRIRPDGAQYERNGRVRRIKSVDLFEISVVNFPMNTRALTSQVKSENLTIRDAERVLRDAGFSRKEAAAIVAAGFKAMPQRDADEPGDELAAMRRLLTTLSP